MTFPISVVIADRWNTNETTPAGLGLIWIRRGKQNYNINYLKKLLNFYFSITVL